MSSFTATLNFFTLTFLVAVLSLIPVQLFCYPMDCSTPGLWSLSISRILPKFMSIELVMPSTNLFSVVPFSFCLQSFPESGSFQMSQFFASGGQSIGALASASVLPMNVRGWFSLRLTGLISLQSKGLPRVFSRTTVQKHQSFGTQLSL